MLEEITILLQNLDSELTIEEMADVLWLATYIDESVINNPNFLDSANSYNSKKSPQKQYVKHQINEEEKSRSEEKKSNKNAELILPLPFSQDSIFETFRTPGVSNLPGKLEISRSLRPFNRNISSTFQFEMNELATVERISNERIWAPVLTPVKERWLDIALVIENSPTMAIWRPLIKEFNKLLERQGAFRNISVWEFLSGADEKLEFYTFSEQGYQDKQSRNPKELIDVNGRRLILVFSDCVSSGWRNGQISNTIGNWGKYCSVTIAHMLPQYMWHRTSLGKMPPVKIFSDKPASSNSKLKSVSPWEWKRKTSLNGVAVPVINITPNSLLLWANVLSSQNNLFINGIIMPYVHNEKEYDTDENHNLSLRIKKEKEKKEPLELVKRFQSTASPIANQLILCLAAAPLSFPVMRLIQQVMLPQAKQTHLAEILLSGLIDLKYPGETYYTMRSDHIEFEFLPGVRKVLIKNTQISESLEVLELVSRFINQYAGKKFNFVSFIKNPDDKIYIDETVKPFATLSAEVLRCLGGKYSKIAKKLEEEYQDVQEDSNDSFWEELIVQEEKENSTSWGDKIQKFSQNIFVRRKKYTQYSEELFKHCVDRESPNHGIAWRGFYEIYNPFIYKQVNTAVRQYHYPLARRVPDKITEDIVLNVFTILYNHLGNFRFEKESEAKFRAYLATICRRNVHQYMRPKYIAMMVDPPEPGKPFSEKKIEGNAAFEVYDFLVKYLREKHSHRENIERDIHIFYLYSMKGLSIETILFHPALKNEMYSKNRISKIVSRIRTSIKNDADFIDELMS